MATVTIGEGQIAFTPDNWDSAVAEIAVVGAKQLVRGVRKRDSLRKKADLLGRNAVSLATSVYDQLETTERSELLAHLRLKQGVEKWSQLQNQAYSMVGEMVNSGKGGEFAEKLFDAMLETSSDPASQARGELIWRLYLSNEARLTEMAQSRRRATT